MKNLLEINHLSVSFKNGKETLRAVRDISLSVKKGEVMGLVGESGSGKSVTALSVAGLISNSPKIDINGRILFKGKQLIARERSRQLESQKISMIFQDPLDSLNPAFTIGEQIAEVLTVRKKIDKKTAAKRSLKFLEEVSIPSPRLVARRYPHQLSGGMCQRVMIAIALAAEPDLLIADEPTTALDVTIQAQILRLLYQLYDNTGTAILFITHDLGIIAQFCHTAAIMLEGRIVEKGRVADIFKNPVHPYTRGLINSIPVLGRKKRLTPIPPEQGGSPMLDHCSFYPRCLKKTWKCSKIEPGFIEMEAGHFVRCHEIQREPSHD